MGSTNVFAEWTKVDWTDEYINYVDLDSIQINGSKVKMWFLIDYIDHTKVHKFKGTVYLSLKGQYEFDCQEIQSRGLASIGYSGNMSYGQVVGFDYAQYPWHSVPPGSVIEDNFNIACKK
jgi:hypothetical protein